MARIDSTLRAAVEQGASDIHFSAGERVWARIDGDLTAFEGDPLSVEQLEPIIMEILSDKERGTLAEKKNLDKSYFLEGTGNFRVNIFYTRRGIGSVIRALPSKIPTIAELGLPPVIKRLAELPKGLILVTGPTGSGKSTTLAAILNHMNENFPYHILTAEDPVEFIHTSKQSLINQREIGHSCPTFTEALKYALREDPDVILVGEMRDLETISLALTAAETGHLVLGTLHTRGAASTMDRIIESFPPMQQAMVRAMLAESLQAVISQTLVRRAGGSGRVAAYEIMVMNYAISNLVREGKTFQVPSIIQTGRKEGMVLMEAHLRELAEAGEISVEDANEVISTLTRGATSGGAVNSPQPLPPSLGGGKTAPGGKAPSGGKTPSGAARAPSGAARAPAIGAQAPAAGDKTAAAPAKRAMPRIDYSSGENALAALDEDNADYESGDSGTVVAQIPAKPASVPANAPARPTPAAVSAKPPGAPAAAANPPAPPGVAAKPPSPPEGPPKFKPMPAPTSNPAPLQYGQNKTKAATPRPMPVPKKKAG